MFDRVLIRPSVVELVETLLAAQTVVDRYAGLLSQSRTDWEREAVGFKADREGRRFWSGRQASRRVSVGVVWWTDARGRRHFRIVARDVAPTTDGDPFSRKVGVQQRSQRSRTAARRRAASAPQVSAPSSAETAAPIRSLATANGPKPPKLVPWSIQNSEARP